MASLLNALLAVCVNRQSTYWIAYSGGIDSHVLLHLASRLRDLHSYTFRAVYVNHGLQPSAEAFAAHAEKTCKELDIEFLTLPIQISQAPGESLEEIAREKRYAALRKLLNPRDYLLTAHHANDQAETVLLQLLRGAGPKGLAAMPKCKPLGEGFLVRPFISIPKYLLQAYAHEYGLQWIEDETNNNLSYTRNYLRHKILPLLQERWPNVALSLVRSAQHCASQDQLLQESLQKDFIDIFNPQTKSLHIEKLQVFSETKQIQLLRLWVQTLGLPMPSAVKIKEILKTFLTASCDKQPYIFWGKVALRRFKQAIYILEIKKNPPQKKYHWPLLNPLSIPHVGTLSCETTRAGPGLCAGIAEVEVRFRRGGEYCKLPNRPFHHSLKKLFQVWGVPPWERGRIPLLYVDAQLIGVVGYFLDERFQAKEGALGHHIVFTPD